MRFDFSRLPLRNRAFSNKPMTFCDAEPKGALSSIIDLIAIETGKRNARENWQKEQLTNLLKHAYERSPFWRKRIGTKKISADQIVRSANSHAERRCPTGEKRRLSACATRWNAGVSALDLGSIRHSRSVFHFRDEQVLQSDQVAGTIFSRRSRPVFEQDTIAHSDPRGEQALTRHHKSRLPRRGDRKLDRSFGCAAERGHQQAYRLFASEPGSHIKRAGKSPNRLPRGSAPNYKGAFC